MMLLKPLFATIGVFALLTSGVAATDKCCCAGGVSTDASPAMCAQVCAAIGSKVATCPADTNMPKTSPRCCTVGDTPETGDCVPCGALPPDTTPVAQPVAKPVAKPAGEEPSDVSKTIDKCCCKSGVVAVGPISLSSCQTVCSSGGIVKCSADAASIPPKNKENPSTGSDGDQNTGGKIKDKANKIGKTIGQKGKKAAKTVATKGKKAAKTVAGKSKELGNQTKQVADKEAKLLGVEPLVVYIVAGGVGFLLLSLVTYCCCCRRKRKKSLDEAMKFVPLDTNGQSVQQQHNANTVNYV